MAPPPIHSEVHGHLWGTDELRAVFAERAKFAGLA
jgi:hypothetical protein